MSIEDERQHAMSLISQLERRIDRHEDKIQLLETIPASLAGINERLGVINRRLDDADRELQGLRAGLAANTTITTDVREAQIAGRVLTNAAKWLSGMILSLGVIWGVIYAATHGGNLPPGK